MSTTQNDLNGISGFARLTAGILFTLMVGMGYAVSPRVESAIDFPVQLEESDTAEARSLASGCVADGLVFADCSLDF